MDRKPLPLAAFAIVTLLPVLCLALASVLGGSWLWFGFLYMALLALVLDQILPMVSGNSAPNAEFPGSDGLLAAIAVCHLLLLPISVWVIAGASGLGTGERILYFLAAGYWFGQVAHPAAHELIHRGNRWLFRLGVAIYTTLLIGHHASAHRLVHHRAVATPDDPASAPAGMSFWRFAPRSWLGSFRAGLAEETRRTAGTARLHPYVVYIGGALASLALGGAIGGVTGLLVWFGLAAHAQLQMALADYVQHYGLRRVRIDDDRYEPVSTRHSWNTPHWFSSALMLNAPRHSDHHTHPTRPYPQLQLDDAAPMLPWPLPLACALAMWPRLWVRRMKPHVAKWSA